MMQHTPRSRIWMLASLGLTAAFALEIGSCGEPRADDTSGRVQEPIVNGQESGFKIWRGAIAVRIDPGNNVTPYICTGSLIHPEIVLTAGHCVYNESLSGFDFRNKPGALEIQAGANLYNQGSWWHVASVLRAAVHPDWKGWPGLTPDVAMLLLDHPVTDLPIYCPVKAAPVKNDPGVLVGYGMTNSQDTTTIGTHRWGDTTIMSLIDYEIEVGGGKSGFCNGDSGGPLFTRTSGKYRIAGINTHYRSAECTDTGQSFAINLTTYLSWVKSTACDWKNTTIGDRCNTFGPDDPSTFDLPADTPCFTGVDGGADGPDAGGVTDGGGGNSPFDAPTILVDGGGGSGGSPLDAGRRPPGVADDTGADGGCSCTAVGTSGGRPVGWAGSWMSLLLACLVRMATRRHT